MENEGYKYLGILELEVKEKEIKGMFKTEYLISVKLVMGSKLLGRSKIKATWRLLR